MKDYLYRENNFSIDRDNLVLNTYDNIARVEMRVEYNERCIFN